MKNGRDTGDVLEAVAALKCGRLAAGSHFAGQLVHGWPGFDGCHTPLKSVDTSLEMDLIGGSERVCDSAQLGETPFCGGTPP